MSTLECMCSSRSQSLIHVTQEEQVEGQPAPKGTLHISNCLFIDNQADISENGNSNDGETISFVSGAVMAIQRSLSQKGTLTTERLVELTRTQCTLVFSNRFLSFCSESIRVTVRIY